MGGRKGKHTHPESAATKGGLNHSLLSRSEERATRPTPQSRASRGCTSPRPLPVPSHSTVLHLTTNNRCCSAPRGASTHKHTQAWGGRGARCSEESCYLSRLPTGHRRKIPWSLLKQHENWTEGPSVSASLDGWVGSGSWGEGGHLCTLYNYHHSYKTNNKPLYRVYCSPHDTFSHVENKMSAKGQYRKRGLSCFLLGDGADPIKAFNCTIWP